MCQINTSRGNGYIKREGSFTYYVKLVKKKNSRVKRGQKNVVNFLIKNYDCEVKYQNHNK